MDIILSIQLLDGNEKQKDALMKLYPDYLLIMIIIIVFHGWISSPTMAWSSLTIVIALPKLWLLSSYSQSIEQYFNYLPNYPLGWFLHYSLSLCVLMTFTLHLPLRKVLVIFYLPSKFIFFIYY